jgi:hypothetical protein
MGQKWLDGYSADVEIYLIYNGSRYDVAQIGNGSLIMREPAPIPAETLVTLVMIFDGHEVREKVKLTSSAETCEEAVPFF